MCQDIRDGGGNVFGLQAFNVCEGEKTWSRPPINEREWQSGQERHGEPGAPITEAEFDVAPFRGSYCRITVVDVAGRRAWGNPIWP